MSERRVDGPVGSDKRGPRLAFPHNQKAKTQFSTNISEAFYKRACSLTRLPLASALDAGTWSSAAVQALSAKRFFCRKITKTREHVQKHQSGFCGWLYPLDFARLVAMSSWGQNFGQSPMCLRYVFQGVLPSIQRDVTFPGWGRCPFSFACRGASLATGE